MKKLVVLFFVLAAFVAAGCDSIGSGKAVATVNGKDIKLQELEDEIENLPPQYKMLAQNPDIRKIILLHRSD